MWSNIFKFNPHHDEKGRFASKPGTKVSSDILADHNTRYDDPSVTEKDILDKFTSAEKGEIALATIKAQTAPTSKDLYTDKYGHYSKERLAMHKKIIDEILSPENIARATPNRGESPTFIVLGGRGGSGKSSFTNGKIKEFDAQKFLVLDTDEIKKSLKPPYKGWNAFSVHEESGDLFDYITSKAKDMGLNLVHDSTMKSLSVEETVKGMKNSGYRIEGHYMYVPRQEAASRAVKRYLGKGPDKRGRLVPVSVVLDNTNNEKNFDHMKKYFDKWSAYDNQGDAPKLIDRSNTNERR